jgi:sterol desaturase/sphingolipid hydroxylase (fatty acid hydroxylase superfamily)
LRPRRQREFPALRRRLSNVGFWVANLALATFLFDQPAGLRPVFELLLRTHLPSWPIANPWLGLAVGFVLLDLLRYAVHRCEHAVPLFWRFHALHHSDPDLDVTTSLRHHPLEILLASIPYWLAAIVFDIPGVLLASYGLAVFISEAFQHGNICLPERLERCLQPLLVTADMHRIHHSLMPDQADSNYGAVLSVWDRLFGTYTTIARARHRDLRFGVRELPSRDCLTPSSMILTPWLLARADGARR